MEYVIVIIGQYPLCSYSGNVQHSDRVLNQINNPVPVPGIPMVHSVISVPIQEGKDSQTLSVQVFTNFYNFAWLHNDKPSSSFMTPQAES